jgi:hypothetical protein
MKNEGANYPSRVLLVLNATQSGVGRRKPEEVISVAYCVTYRSRNSAILITHLVVHLCSCSPIGLMSTRFADRVFRKHPISVIFWLLYAYAS